jgi:hypothetical protein
MGRKHKYTEEHISKVQEYVNNGMNQREAIKKAGFSDASLFYKALDRFGLMKEVNFVPIVSFL